MKISINNKNILALTDIQKRVIKNDIREDVFEDDMKRRLQWVVQHKYERCFKRLKDKWDHKLIANGVKSVPTDPDEYAQLVFSQPNYKDRKQREVEAEEALSKKG